MLSAQCCLMSNHVQAAKLQLGGKLQQRLSKAQQQDLLTNHALLLQASGQKDTSAAMVAALQSRQVTAQPGQQEHAVLGLSSVTST